MANVVTKAPGHSNAWVVLAASVNAWPIIQKHASFESSDVNVIFVLVLLSIGVLHFTPDLAGVFVDAHFLGNHLRQMDWLDKEHLVIADVVLDGLGQSPRETHQSVTNMAVVDVLANNNHQSAGGATHANVDVVLLGISIANSRQEFIINDRLDLLLQLFAEERRLAL